MTPYTEERDGLVMQLTCDEHGVKRGAVLSSCGRYRYLLTRAWSDLPVLVFIMLNPSTADGLTDDATIRSCVRLARKLGRGGIMVVNLFAFRATYPILLRACEWTPGHYEEVVGPRNDETIRRVQTMTKDVVVAWGSHAKVRDLVKPRAAAVLELLDQKPPWCFGKNADGQPKHPLYLPSNGPNAAQLLCYRTEAAPPLAPAPEPRVCPCCASGESVLEKPECACPAWCPNS